MFYRLLLKKPWKKNLSILITGYVINITYSWCTPRLTLITAITTLLWYWFYCWSWFREKLNSNSPLCAKMIIDQMKKFFLLLSFLSCFFLYKFKSHLLDFKKLPGLNSLEMKLFSWISISGNNSLKWHYNEAFNILSAVFLLTLNKTK